MSTDIDSFSRFIPLHCRDSLQLKIGIFLLPVVTGKFIPFILHPYGHATLWWHMRTAIASQTLLLVVSILDDKCSAQKKYVVTVNVSARIAVR